MTLGHEFRVMGDMNDLGSREPKLLDAMKISGPKLLDAMKSSGFRII